jgi:predicted Fe-Mo cluster-binding NifX family protein
MRVVVSSMGEDLDSESSPKFGRSPIFLFVETESMKFEAARNVAADATSGAGVQAAQFVAGKDVRAVITGEVGPKAMQVLHAAGIPVYLSKSGTVRQVVERLEAGTLPLAPGSFDDMGRREANSDRARGEEIAALEEEVARLRGRLADILERVNQL